MPVAQSVVQPRGLTDAPWRKKYGFPHRGLAGGSVWRYAPANHVPLAFSDFDDGTVNLLKVAVN